MTRAMLILTALLSGGTITAIAQEAGMGANAGGDGMTGEAQSSPTETDREATEDETSGGIGTTGSGTTTGATRDGEDFDVYDTAPESSSEGGDETGPAGVAERRELDRRSGEPTTDPEQRYERANTRETDR